MLSSTTVSTTALLIDSMKTGIQSSTGDEKHICWLCKHSYLNLMFIGLCIIVIVEEWKTNLMSLAILFHFLCAQHVLDINISGACDCVDELPHRSSCSQFVVCWSFGAADFRWCSFCRLKACKTNWEQDDQCGNSSTQSQAPGDGYINVRNMLST